MGNLEITDLLRKFDAGLCTEEEKAIVESWYIRQKPLNVPDLSPAELESDLEEVFHRLPRANPSTGFLRLRIWAVAAAVLLCLGVGWYFYHLPKHDAGVAEQLGHVKPGNNGATLTLANGRKISLSSQSIGRLAQENGITVSKDKDGLLVYKVTADSGSKVFSDAHHLLSTANGQQYQVILPDGTRVWLNAASSLQFPVTFAGLASRQVKVTGEAYFQVAKDKDHPFEVQSPKQRIIVLGTHFNVNCYADEQIERTTLLEGSVSLATILHGGSRLLKPNQQALVDQDINIINLDPEASIGWRNGNFYFYNERIDEVMRKLARWYDLQIEYRNPVKEVVYGGEIGRDRALTDVLKLLEVTGTVHFKIEGRRVVVMQ